MGQQAYIDALSSRGNSTPEEFVRGAGLYVPDIRMPDTAYATAVRSDHANADIVSIDTSAARSMPGVLGVVVADDLRGQLQPIPCIIPVTQRDGRPRADAPLPILATGVVRYVGQPVAVVVARTLEQAQNAATEVVISYAPHAAVVDIERAAQRGAPQVHAEVPDNVCFDWELSDSRETQRIFADAAHVTYLTLRNNRVTAAPLEPRNAIGVYDRGSECYTLISATQGVHLVRRVLADQVLGIPQDHLRVLTTDVGGGFGSRIAVFPEQAFVLWAARHFGCPVTWIAERTESFLADTHGRDNLTHAELALAHDATIIAVRVSTSANMGAYLSLIAPFIPTECGPPLLSNIYRISHIHARVRGIFTHTAPVDAYRGAGRPEAIFVIERLIDKAARELKLDPLELRLRNVIRARDLPYRTAAGLLIDSGNFEDNLHKARVIVSHRDAAYRQQQAHRRNALHGIGAACYVEANGGLALARRIEAGKKPVESARAAFLPNGTVLLRIGTQTTGQGHDQTYAQLLGNLLGISASTIRVAEGDSGGTHAGGGTGGSKSLLIGSQAVRALAARIIEQGKALAAARLSVHPQDVVFSAGNYRTDSEEMTVGLIELAQSASEQGNLDCEATVTLDAGSYATGCHVCEVEIDKDTGHVQIISYSAIDDFGEIMDRARVESQVHGGVTQGIGQALLEHIEYDPESGQLLTASFDNYALPRADNVPVFHWLSNGSRCSNNELGIKACGESGASAAPPAVINAIADALDGLISEDIQMPATSEQVWRLLDQARQHRTQDGRPVKRPSLSTTEGGPS